MTLKVNITRLDKNFDDIPLPEYATSGSAGMDVRAAINDTLTIKAGGVALVSTSIAIALSEGYECQVRSRSGLAAKNGIFALNAPGTIDSDYRGEIKVILANFSKDDFIINRGDRIAQLVVTQYDKVQWQVVRFLDETLRNDGGFGSTGVNE